MFTLNSIKTYAEVFLRANKEQLDTGGVVLFQGVFEPLPADRKKKAILHPPAGTKTIPEQTICS